MKDAVDFHEFLSCRPRPTAISRSNGALVLDMVGADRDRGFYVGEMQSARRTASRGTLSRRRSGATRRRCARAAISFYA
jgi:hypothetical protein